jgi:hypothetical protein
MEASRTPHQGEHNRPGAEVARGATQTAPRGAQRLVPSAQWRLGRLYNKSEIFCSAIRAKRVRTAALTGGQMWQLAWHAAVGAGVPSLHVPLHAVIVPGCARGVTDHATASHHAYPPKPSHHRASPPPHSTSKAEESHIYMQAKGTHAWAEAEPREGRRTYAKNTGRGAPRRRRRAQQALAGGRRTGARTMGEAKGRSEARAGARWILRMPRVRRRALKEAAAAAEAADAREHPCGRP